MPTPRQLIVIINPNSGPRGERSRQAKIVDALRGLSVRVEILTTERPGHALEIARDVHLDAQDAVVAVGGDGTLHEVVNGLLARPDGLLPAIGVVAAGTGNATCIDLGLSETDAAIAAIRSGHTRAIDVARVTVDGHVHHAINVIGWGAFARINHRAERLRFFGGSRYTLAALGELLLPRIRSAEVTLDGEAQDRFLLGAACLTRYSGRGMKIAPLARLDDGYVDLVLIRKGPRVLLGALLRRVFTGDHLDSPRVEYRRREAIHLELDPGSSLVIDGELLPARHVSIEVRCQALRVLTPGFASEA